MSMIKTKPAIATLGVDLGKNSCSLAGLDASGAVIFRKRVTREDVVTFAASLPPCVVAMEACFGAHFVGSVLASQGHTVRLMSRQYVRPYVKTQKTDDRDAEAIAEAATRPTMRFVKLKTEGQLDLQIMHRLRDRLIAGRTALINQLRSLLLERGVIMPKGRKILMKRLSEIETELSGLSYRTRKMLEDLRDEWVAIDRKIASYDEELAALVQQDSHAQRLATIPGIGAINATALVAAVGDGSAFEKGRDLAAWLGLTPRQHSTGGKTRMLGISKRGNSYLRKQLVHGARSAMRHLVHQPNKLGQWLKRMLGHAHPNLVVVALAAKLARVASQHVV